MLEMSREHCKDNNNVLNTVTVTDYKALLCTMFLLPLCFVVSAVVT